MKFRKLRIAFSGTCAIACVALILLWVRSYSDNLHDVFLKQTSSRVHILDSREGRLAYCQRFSMLNRRTPRMLDPENMNDIISGSFGHQVPHFGCVHIYAGSYSSIVFAPHWFAVLCFA